MAFNATTDPGLPCILWPDKPHHCDVVVAIKRTTASISLIGTLFMILVIWLLKKYAVFSQRLILYLTIAAFFDCTAYLMTDMELEGTLCNFEAFWMTYWDWSVLLWVATITFCLFFSVVRETKADKYIWPIHAVCWLLPLLLASLPFSGGHYGPAGAWCWIKADIPSWRFGIWYVPLFIMISAMFVAYSYIIFRLRGKILAWEGNDPDVDRHKELLRQDIQPLRTYPFIYLAVSIFPLINRIQNAVEPDHPVFALWVLHALSGPLQGFLNALVFGIDRETRQHLTPAQIKMALQNRFSRPEVQEYPSVQEQPYNTLMEE